ncbi:hypothetical protein GA0111570_10120 [Raineyella antarctica]|uniref:histidine kinase n=1 Tax=Raineyella antarctica TaxID=1577474 RepID=A0A1G6GCN8_9ACTN|nr:HAMP domain-containing sensor histidine kinase [Raineyella antarctica]SDB79751.1 hypothetical protein GA0111570_10120 [Raineyella antarctica]
MSLRLRVTLIFTLGMLIVVSVVGWWLVNSLSHSVDVAMDTSLRARADALVQQYGAGTGFQDGALRASGLSPVDTLAQVVDGSDRLVETSEGAGTDPLLTPTQLAQARTAPLSVNTTLPGGEPVRVFAMSMESSGTPSALVITGTSRRTTLATLHDMVLQLVAGGATLMALATMVEWLAVGATLKPIERMRQKAEQISGDPDSAARLPVGRRHDEVARLGHTFNDLIERMQHSLSQQRRFVADASHELRTPLTMLRAELELGARAGRRPEEVQQSLRSAHADTERLVRLVNGLLAQATADTAATGPDRGLVDLAATAAEAVDLMNRAHSDVAIALQVTDGPFPMVGSHDRLVQLAINLIDNAVKASPVGGRVDVLVEPDERDDGLGVLLCVGDRGKGFEEGFLPHATERFAREQPTEVGTGAGLGLAIVESIAREHGATLQIGNRADGGARVCVRFPIVTQ